MLKTSAIGLFDILFTRKVAKPEHIHLITGQKFKKLTGIEPEIFANGRILAEKDLSGVVHGLSIYDIYKKLTEKFEISETLIDELIQAEFEAVLMNLLPVEENIRLLEKKRNLGYAIVFIIDSHFSEGMVKKLLTELKIFEDADKIFVSGDMITRINNGTIFRTVLEELELDEHLLHYHGDLSGIDASVFRELDCKFTTLTVLPFNRYENYLSALKRKYRLNHQEKIYFSNMAAASRYARMSQPESSDDQIFNVAASVAGPFLYNFISWVLEKAADKRLYFIARDGYVLHEIAKKIINEKNLDTDIRYLYISREVLILAGIHELDRNEFIDYLRKLYTDDTVYDLLNRLAVGSETIERAELKDLDLSKNVSELGVENLNRIFFHSAIHKKILKESVSRKERLVEYLKYEGFLNPGNEEVAIVDSGWNLTTQNMLAKILKIYHQKPPSGYYFGIYESAYSSIQNGEKYGYLWNLRRNHVTLNVKNLPFLMEVFCSAPHGRTLDYRVMNNSVKPVLNDHQNSHLEEWGVKDLENGILKLTDVMLDINSDQQASKWQQVILIDLLSMLWKRPDPSEVERWGAYPFIITDNGNHVVYLFERRPFRTVLNHIIKSGKLPHSHLDRWPYALLYNYKYWKRLLVKFILRLKRSFYFLRVNYHRGRNKDYIKYIQ